MKRIKNYSLLLPLPRCKSPPPPIIRKRLCGRTRPKCCFFKWEIYKSIPSTNRVRNVCAVSILRKIASFTSAFEVSTSPAERRAYKFPTWGHRLFPCGDIVARGFLNSPQLAPCLCPSALVYGSGYLQRSAGPRAEHCVLMHYLWQHCHSWNKLQELQATQRFEYLVKAVSICHFCGLYKWNLIEIVQHQGNPFLESLETVSTPRILSMSRDTKPSTQLSNR